MYFRIMSAIGPLYAIAMFCILIWGSVIVFGKLNFFSVLLVDIIINPTLTGLFLIIINDIQFKGNYGDWEYDETMKGDDNYCGYTPFLFAFVMLILHWLVLPFIICCACMMCCAGCGAALAMMGLAAAMDDEQK